MTRRTRWFGLIFFIVVCLGAGGLGAIATTPEIEGWYKSIVKPTWNPPDSVFGPVWTTLFIMMGLAAWVVWRRGGFKAASMPLACPEDDWIPSICSFSTRLFDTST